MSNNEMPVSEESPHCVWNGDVVLVITPADEEWSLAEYSVCDSRCNHS